METNNIKNINFKTTCSIWNRIYNLKLRENTVNGHFNEDQTSWSRCLLSPISIHWIFQISFVKFFLLSLNKSPCWEIYELWITIKNKWNLRDGSHFVRKARDVPEGVARLRAGFYWAPLLKKRLNYKEKIKLVFKMAQNK